MGTEFKGFVAKIGKKEGAKNGRAWKLYSVKLEAADGTEIPDWISAGFDAPNFKEGDYVKLSASKNDRGYWNIDKGTTPQVSKNPPARGGGQKKSDEVAQDSGSSHGNYNRGGVDWNSAAARATDIVKMLIEVDALPLSAAKGAGGTAKRYDEVVTIIDKLTVKLYNDSTTLRLLETVADTVVDTKADGDLPDAGDDETPDAEGGDDGFD